MKLVILLSCVTVGSCAIDYTAKEFSDKADSPVAFGYKMAWLAIRSDAMSSVVDALELENVQSANWRTGIDYCYRRNPGVFVSPPIDGWILVVGKLPEPGDAKATDSATPFLKALGQRFAEVQYFGTHRVVSYVAWARIVAGKRVRAYAYVGDHGHTSWNHGDMSEAERSLHLVFAYQITSEADSDAFWHQDKLHFPDEDTVMKIAGEWSINPMMLEKKNLAPGVGVVGDMPKKWYQ